MWFLILQKGEGYYSRHSTRDEVIRVFDRIVDAARELPWEQEQPWNMRDDRGLTNCYMFQVSKSVCIRTFQNRGLFLHPEEKAFAEEISKTLNRKLNTEFIEGVVPYETPQKPE